MPTGSPRGQAGGEDDDDACEKAVQVRASRARNAFPTHARRQWSPCGLRAMTMPPLQLLSVVTHVPPSTLNREDTLSLLPTLAGGTEGAERFRGVVERSRIDNRHVETTVGELEH